MSETLSDQNDQKRNKKEKAPKQAELLRRLSAYSRDNQDEEPHLELQDVFDMDLLQRIQDAFSDATGVAVIIVDRKGRPALKYSNFTAFCSAIRTIPEYFNYCTSSDDWGGRNANSVHSPRIYRCHGGLVDMAVPIQVRGEYIGAILAGQVQIPPEEAATLPHGAPGCPTDFSDHPEFLKLRKDVYHSTLKRVRGAADLMFTIANYLAELSASRIMQEKLQRTNEKLMLEMHRRTEAESALRDADLRALKAQINPHFFFNVLNTIGRLAMLEGATQTQEMVYHFSDLLRYTLKSGDNDFVKLKDEIDNAKNFLHIQKVRQGDHLLFSFDCDETLNDAFCPFMVIQPFVENAIKYVVEARREASTITIKTEADGGDILIHIIDDGDGIPDATIDALLGENARTGETEKGMGIGVKNVNKRLRYYYGKPYGVSYVKGLDAGTHAIIRIPNKTLPESR
jgi:two-component system LytT family sensor kinase